MSILLYPISLSSTCIYQFYNVLERFYSNPWTTLKVICIRHIVNILIDSIKIDRADYFYSLFACPRGLKFRNNVPHRLTGSEGFNKFMTNVALVLCFHLFKIWLGGMCQKQCRYTLIGFQISKRMYLAGRCSRWLFTLVSI